MRVINPNGSDSVGDDRDYEYDDDEDDEEDEDEDNDDNDGEGVECDEENNEINSEFDEENLEDNLTENETIKQNFFNENFEISDFNPKRGRSGQSLGQNFGLNVRSKKKSSENREGGLWWDEDEALNELTSSVSFEFGHRGNTNNYDEADEEDDELETLETMLRNSDLFRSPAISASSSSILRPHPIDNQLIKRLSLS